MLLDEDIHCVGDAEDLFFAITLEQLHYHTMIFMARGFCYNILLDITYNNIAEVYWFKTATSSPECFVGS